MAKRYKVTFEEKIDEFTAFNSEWVADQFSNGGKGWDLEYATFVKEDIEKKGLDGIPVRNVKIEEI